MSDLYIMHYGVGHDKGGHSGRYPWGSGDEPYQDLSAAEKRRQFLDKHWYHKGSKIRLGVDHIRDVDPTTKISDLFKYNKRSTSDVLADKILTFMYGDTEMDREELRRKKYNLMSAITAAEAVAATAIIAKGLGSIKTGVDFIQAYRQKRAWEADIAAGVERGKKAFSDRTYQNLQRQSQIKGMQEDMLDLKRRVNIGNAQGMTTKYVNHRVLPDVGMIPNNDQSMSLFQAIGSGTQAIGEGGSKVIEDIVEKQIKNGGTGGRF